jgi:hypothetical protein
MYMLIRACTRTYVHIMYLYNTAGAWDPCDH